MRHEMIKITGLNHIVLRTNQLKAMLAFYVDVLGCTIEKQQPDFHLTQLRAGQHLIDLVEVGVDVDISNSNLAHFCLDIEAADYESIRQYLVSHSITPERFGRRYSARGYGDSFFLIDPQGNELELAFL
jgi:glyoxylase I family protein